MNFKSTLLPVMDAEINRKVTDLFSNNFIDLLLEKYDPLSSYTSNNLAMLAFLFSLRNELGRVLSVLGDNLNQKVLDLGCGAAGGERAESRLYGPTAYQPWFCRALHELGIPVIGIDVGDLSREPFEHYTLDLSKDGALDIFPDHSMKIIQAHMLYTSPETERRYTGNLISGNASREAADSLENILQPQIERIVSSDGYYFSELNFDEKYSFPI